MFNIEKILKQCSIKIIAPTASIFRKFRSNMKLMVKALRFIITFLPMMLFKELYGRIRRKKEKELEKLKEEQIALELRRMKRRNVREKRQQLKARRKR